MEAESQDSEAPQAESMETDTPETPAAPSSPPKKSIKLTYEEYKSMANLFVLYMRRQEEEMEDTDNAGVRKSGLIDWYLREMESEIETENDLMEKKVLAEKVLYRLVHHDHVIIQLDSTGLTGKGKHATDDQLVREDDPILVVHPNYVIQD